MNKFIFKTLSIIHYLFSTMYFNCILDAQKKKDLKKTPGDHAGVNISEQ